MSDPKQTLVNIIHYYDSWMKPPKKKKIKIEEKKKKWDKKKGKTEKDPFLTII